jgi:murein DD-endopeptidase MepM/ murein hydrolase activator NlpD
VTRRIAAALASAAAAAGLAASASAEIDWQKACGDLAQHAPALRHARHDDRARYRLPYPAEIPRICSQGVGGPTHRGAVRHAFDFVMPQDTPILAARAGEVLCVVDGFGPGDYSERSRYEANAVMVLHDDGTVAEYAHLRAGIAVKPGQRVETGDVLGHCGRSGYANGPHLHFAVWAPDADGRQKTVRIFFGQAGTSGFVPQAGGFYGARPPSRVKLSIHADGKTVRAEQRIAIARGGSVRLRVFWVRPDGTVDLTRVPETRIDPVTPWTLAVDAEGVVHARPSPGFENGPDREQTTGQVFVLYEGPASPSYGWRILDFDIAD